MKRLITIIITAIFLAGCSVSSPGVPSSSVSSPDSLKGSTFDNGANSPNETDNKFTLSSIDFLDENNGWIIKGKFQSTDESSQLLRTQDGGAHWNKIGTGDMAIDRIKFIDQAAGWAIAHDPNDVKILFTKDGGESWEVQWQGKGNISTKLDLWFQDSEKGYALIDGMLLATQDGGKQWTAVSFGKEKFIPQNISFASYDTGWAIGIIGDTNTLVVLNTADAGKQWKQQFEKKYKDGPIGSIDIEFINSSTGWFLTSDLATWNGELYYTADAGDNWKAISQIKCIRPAPTELEFIDGKIGWIPLDVGAGPIEGGLLFTDDGGKNFKLMNDSQENAAAAVVISGMYSAKGADFISEKQGWVIGEDLNNGDYLIKTTDGGKVWNKVYP